VTTLRGLAGAFILFAASFALHIVGGATDQGWLFVLAVVLIYLTAAGFPALAHLLAGQPAASRAPWLLGGAIGIVLTASALRAANDRTFEWWMAPLAIGLVAVTSAAIVGLARARRAFATRQPA
jgi:hypothetical protein